MAVFSSNTRCEAEPVDLETSDPISIHFHQGTFEYVRGFTLTKWVGSPTVALSVNSFILRWLEAIGFAFGFAFTHYPRDSRYVLSYQILNYSRL